MSIEENIARFAEAQERTATALEAILAHLGSSTSLTLAAGVVGADIPDDQAAAEAKAAEEAAAAKKKAAEAAAAKKKAEAEAVAKKKAEEEAAAKAAEVDPLADPPAEETKKITKDDVRAALMAYREIEGAPAMMEILKTVGKATSLDGVKAEDYAAVIAATK